MGDLKVGESFEDRVYIVDSSGAAKTGLAPSCTIIDESGNRVVGTVAEMASGWYKVTDFTPDAAGTWCLEWAVAGAYIIQYPNKLFKVGGGRTEDINTTVNTFYPKYNTPIVFNQTTVIQNTWYTVATLTNCELMYLPVSQTNGETAAKTLEIRFVADGVTISAFGISVNDNSTQYAYVGTNLNHTLPLDASTRLAYYSAPFKARSLVISMRTTDVPGTSQTLKATVKYNTLN